MQSDDGRRIESVLLARVAKGANSTEIADAVIAALEEVDSALSPIIGKRGSEALLKRSLHLAGARHPWLRAEFDESGALLEREPLRSLLACRSGGETASAGGELLGGFREMLNALIGPSLTEQLLGSAWSHITSGPSAQKASS